LQEGGEGEGGYNPRMLIKHAKFSTTDWFEVPPEKKPGEAGVATWRTLEAGNARVRIVEYSPGYRADHWCERGHVLYVLEGELVTELKDGRTFKLKAGMSYQVGDEQEPHRSHTDAGAKLFVVD
jgi:quercetin dioxygenase-like cupin family protein